MPADPPRLFTDRFARLVAAAASSREPSAQPPYLVGGAGGPISERLLQCIWFDQLLDRHALRTPDGRPVRVRAPGFWNLEAGPDFFRAEIQFADEAPVQGDVEVHLRPEDWSAHGHHSDPRYDGTILHVVFANPRDQRHVSTSAGTAVPQVELETALSADLQDLRAQLELTDYPYASPANIGACCRAGFTGASPAYWKLIALAGEARLLLKARRAATLGSDWDQALYAMLLQALGYRPFAGAGLELARRLPHSILRAAIMQHPENLRRTVAEALLLGTAGLLPAPSSPGLDDEACAYAGSLQEVWRGLRRETAVDVMDPEVWRGARVRPANRPVRRLAAAARLLTPLIGGGLCRRLAEAIRKAPDGRAAWQTLERLLTLSGDGFWARRVDFHTRAGTRPQRLVGSNRARILAIDAVLPVLLGWARSTDDRALESTLHDMAEAMPAQASNSKLRLALYRMTGAPDAWPRTTRTALHAQGLLHVLQDWCIQRPTCDGCGVYAILDHGDAWANEKGPRHP